MRWHANELDARGFNSCLPTGSKRWLADIPLPPELQHQQIPDLVPEIGSARIMRIHHLLDRSSTEQAVPCQPLRRQRRLHVALKTVDQPFVDRHDEALLGPSQKFARQQVGDRLLQNVLHAPALDLDAPGQADGGGGGRILKVHADRH